MRIVSKIKIERATLVSLSNRGKFSAKEFNLKKYANHTYMNSIHF